MVSCLKACGGVPVPHPGNPQISSFRCAVCHCHVRPTQHCALLRGKTGLGASGDWENRKRGVGVPGQQHSQSSLSWPFLCGFYIDISLPCGILYVDLNVPVIFVVVISYYH